MTAFAKMCDINCMMAGKSAFGANAMEEEQQVQQITAFLDNLVNASIQKNATIDNLVVSNAQLAQVLQDMQAAIVHMFPSGQVQPCPNQAPTWWSTPPAVVAPPAAPLAPALAVEGPRPAHWGMVKPAWDKQDYCWSHRHKVKVGHTSTTCSSQHAGHQPGATGINTMGRSSYNAGYPGPGVAPPPAPA
jgi:hypothetical protein